jgi:murein L,D-transpeptidase YafK
VLAVETKANGYEIPVHLFPARLSDNGMKSLSAEFDDKKLIGFWKDLQPGYKYFEENKKLPQITIAKDGKYVVN